MPKHIDNYQAQEYVSKLINTALDSSKEHKLPFFAVGRQKNVITNMDDYQLEDLKRNIDDKILKRQKVCEIKQALQKAINNQL
jgi:hypothetical protein